LDGQEGKEREVPDVMKTVGRYEILREVGRGGMALVYLARQSDLDRFVALKELGAFHASDPSFAQRFLRESRVAGSLSHPNIVTVHDYFEHEGTPYIAMEYVERGSLRPYIGRTTLAQVGGVLEGLLAGLAHAEQNGIVHRDLKPENLMVTADGRVKIADFGIAKATTSMQTGAFLTATGTTVGTPTYMAPEQAMAQDIGPWTDLYSVGCMAFELFTGRVPFHDSDAPMAILLRHVNEPIPPVKSIEPSVDPQISEWVERLLVKEPKSRTQSANEAWDEFEEIMIGLLGPRWRRSARLLGGSAEQVDTPKPLTPAPFEGTSADAAAPSDEFESFAWGTPAAPDTGAGAAPPGPYTPPPQPATPQPPEPQVGPPTPPPSPAAPPPEPAAPEAEPATPEAEPVADEDSGFVTFGAPAPPPPTDALVPPPASPPEGAGAEAPPESTPAEASAAAPSEAAPPAPGEAAPAEPREDAPAEAWGAAAGAPPEGAAPVTPPPSEAVPDDDGVSHAPGFDTYIAPPPARPPTEDPPPDAPAITPSEPVSAAPPPPPPVTPTPEPVAPEPQVAPTVMPESLRERPAPPVTEEEERRGGKAFPIVLVAGAVIAAVIGFLIGGGSGGEETGGGPPVVAANSASLNLKVPEGWSQQPTVPNVPGLGIADPIAYAPEGRAETVVFGAVPEKADNSTLLSEDLIAAAGGVPEDREAVSLGPDDLQAYRYRDVRLEGVDRPLTVYAVPTTEGVATVACLVGAEGTANCDAIANTVQLGSGEPFPVGPNPDYAENINGAIGKLSKSVDKALPRLQRAKTPSAQADAARDLRTAYRSASKTFAGFELSPADRTANAAVVAALNATAGAYGQAAAAAADNDKAAYRKAGQALEKAEKQTNGAITGLARAGYDTES
jgi:hypothetical protein